MIKKTTSFATAILMAILLTGTTSCMKKMGISKTTYHMDDEQVQQLKGKTLIVILPQSQYSYIDQYNELMGSAWTMTPVKAIKYNEIESYSDVNKYSFLEMRGLETTTTTSSGHSYTNTHYFLSLTLRSVTVNKKGKEKKNTEVLSEMTLYPDFNTTNTSFASKNLTDKIYINSEMRNYSVPYVMAYLRFLQKNVADKKGPSRYLNFSDKAMRTKLAQDTLYIPDNLVHSFNMFTGKEALKGESIFSEYKGKYKIVSTEQLINLVKTRKGKPLFVFEYVLSSTDKFVSVWEVNSGTLAYRHYTPVKYNLKSKDLKNII